MHVVVVLCEIMLTLDSMKVSYFNFL